MNISWNPVVYVDMIGSSLTLVIAFRCLLLSREWTKKKPDDIFRHYLFLLTIAIALFALSRSFGHLLKQLLLYGGQESVWRQLSPFSGAINTVTFVVIFAFGIYFQRIQKVHLEIEKYKTNLEEMIATRTAELEETNIVLADEIIEREYTEQALKESQGYLQAILDNTTLPIYLKDVAGSYILINKEYERLAHITNKEILGKNDFEVFPEALATLFQAQDREVVSKNAPLEFEETITLDDGAHTFLTSKFPLRDDGMVYAVGGVCTDITSRKIAEDKLAAEQERLAVTLRSIGDGVITTDTSGRIVLINKVAENLTGWSQAEAFGQPLEEVFQLLTINRERHPNLAAKILATGRIQNLAESTILVSRQGRELIIADSGAPIRDQESNVVGVVLVFRDITHQLKLEAESRKAQKLESVGVLAGGIAHDFNNLLVAILGNISLASLDAGLREKTRQLLAEAEKASLRARDLTQQLLTFSKGGEPVKRISSLQEVIEDSANFVLHGENVACEYELPNDLWLVDIDQGQISQVIQNIIINANHAMPNGGLIKVKCENVESAAAPSYLPRQNYVRISITDNGIGIPVHIIDRIFDPYFSTKSEGSGLGLAICHSIIAKHKGQISVDSRPGKGTTFMITLPAAACSTQVEDQGDPGRAKIQKAKILIMDDEEVVREVAKAMLGQFGYQVVLARHGAEAVELFRAALNSSEPIELTIMDLTVPGGMGGKEAAQELLKIAPAAKIIVSSGYSNDPIMADYRQYGFSGAIVKPYQIREILKTVAEVLALPSE